MPQPQKRKFYGKTEEGGIVFKTQRRPGDVRIPNYVYDIWMPLIGSDAIGLYAVYCRLEMQGYVKKITMADIAGACRIGLGRLSKLNECLQECGFITIEKPAGEKRAMHWTTAIEVLDPPTEVLPTLIQRHAPPRGYQILTPWLEGELEELDDESKDPKTQIDFRENPNRFSGKPNQVFVENPNGSSNIESLGLQPLGVENASPPFGKPVKDYLTDVVTLQGQTSEVTVPAPADQWLNYRDEALAIYQRLSGAWGHTPQEREVRKGLITGGVADRADFDPARFEKSIIESLGAGVGAANIARFWEVYDAGGTYSAWKAKTYGNNGQNSPTSVEGKGRAPKLSPEALALAEEWNKQYQSGV